MSLKSVSHSCVGVYVFAESEIKHLGSITSKIKEASYGTTRPAQHRADKCMFYFCQSLPLAVNLLDKLVRNFAQFHLNHTLLRIHNLSLAHLSTFKKYFFPTCAIRSLFLQQKRHFRELNSIFQSSIFCFCIFDKHYTDYLLLY